MIVLAVYPPDEAWHKKVAAWHACKDAGLRPPDFDFDGMVPSSDGFTRVIPHLIVDGAAVVSVDDIPDGCRNIRFRTTCEDFE